MMRLGSENVVSMQSTFTSSGMPLAISATTGAGLDGLLAAIDDVLPGDPLVRTQLDLSAGDGATLAMLHEFGRVLSTRYQDNRVVVEAEVPESLERRLRVREQDPQICG